jgi:hypothetical protein
MQSSTTSKPPETTPKKVWTHAEWLAANPIKIWMNEDKKKRTGVLIASRVQRTPYLVYLWLKGAASPKKHWDALNDLMNITNIEEAWNEWLSIMEEGRITFDE